MKKLGSLLLCSILLFTPFLASADTTSQTALIGLYEQLISLLTQEVQEMTLAQAQPPVTFTTPSGALIGQNGTVLSTPYIAPTVQPAEDTALTTLQQEWQQTKTDTDTCYAGLKGDITTGTSIVSQGNEQRDIQRCEQYATQLISIKNQISALGGSVGTTSTCYVSPGFVLSQKVCY